MVPYKSRCDPVPDDIDLASNIGAVNTLVRTEKGYKGHNTTAGLYRAMCEDGAVKGQKVLIPVLEE